MTSGFDDAVTALRDNWLPVASKDILKRRAQMLKSIRAFFDASGVLEVETPLVSSAGITEPHVESLRTHFRDSSFYLNTSPEFAMKRLLAAYGEPIFQICKAFRDDELGPNHNPEFTMLEWYRPGFDKYQLMDEIEELLGDIFESKGLLFNRVSYRDAFDKYAGFDPHQAKANDCRDCALQHGIEQPVGLQEKDGWLDWLLTQLVLPALEKEVFTFIYDYPEEQSALARLCQDDSGVQVASRFELFYGEVELANGFHELLDSTVQRQRFENENMKRIEAGQSAVVIDEYLLDALSHGLPDCSGVALGLDRLLMLMCNKKSIDQVLAFPWGRA
jgi:lysyl-tRNA synthetase class 2